MSCYLFPNQICNAHTNVGSKCWIFNPKSIFGGNSGYIVSVYKAITSGGSFCLF